MLRRRLWILIAAVCLAPAAWAKAPAGDQALLEAAGTSVSARQEEKTIYAYTVRPGDTLWDIAGWALRDPFQWPELLKYNYIADPDLIYPGDRLIVPSPEVLRRVRDARDIAELEAIRREAETGAQRVELAPPAETVPAPVTPAARPLILPVMEAETQADDQAVDLKLSGQKTMIFRYRDYAGGVSPYYYSSGYTRQESLDLTLAGQVWNSVKIAGEFHQSDQELENHYALTLSREPWELFLGDFAAALPGTSLVLGSRQVSGGRLRGEGAGFGGVLLAGAAKGEARYDRFFGNRTQGPYYLQAAPVVYGSEKILVNKRPLARDLDYTLDYLSGRLLFLRDVIDDITLVEAVYESRQTVFARALYGGRVWAKPAPWLTVGASTAWEEDPDTAPVAAGGNTVTPIQHRVHGVDLSLDAGGAGTVTGEWAFSRYQPDRNQPEAREGQAGQLTAEGGAGPVRARGYYQRATPDFRMLGQPAQGGDFLNYGGTLDVKTGGAWRMDAAYDYRDTLLEGSREISERAEAAAGIRPWSTVETGYQFFQLGEHSQAASGTLDYRTRRHSALADWRGDFAQAGLRADWEEREGNLGDRGSAVTKGAALSGHSKNLGWLALQAAVEAQEVEDRGDTPAAAAPYRVIKAALTCALTPSDRYSLTADNRWTWDPRQGDTQVLDTKLNLRPLDAARLEAKYTLESLQSLIGPEVEPVFTETASGLLEALPGQGLILRLEPNVRLSRRRSDGRALNGSQNHIGRLLWASSVLSQEATAHVDRSSLHDSTDPALPVQSEQQAVKGVYTVRAALSPAWSLDGSLEYDTFAKTQRSASSAGTDRLDGEQGGAGIGLHSSLLQVLGVDGEYRLTRRRQAGTSPESVTRTAYPISETGRTTADYDVLNSFGSLDTRQDQVKARLTCRWTGVFTTSLEGLYDRNQDLTGRADTIHTASGGLGATATWPGLQAGADATWAQSWGGAATRQAAYGVTLNYNPASLISLALRGSYALTSDPESLSAEGTLTCTVRF